MGGGGGEEEKTNLGEGPGEQPPLPPSHPFPDAHTYCFVRCEQKTPSDKIFFLRASEGNLPQIVVSEILAFLT